MGGVGAVHVEGRIGLGVAASLGLGQRVGVAAGRARVMPVRMKLQVPLRMPCSDRIWLAARLCARAAMIGTPPATLASKAMARPCRRAASKTSAPCWASSALLAVTTSLPAASRISTGSLGPVDAADQLGDDLDGRIAQHLLQIGRQQLARQVDGPRLVGIADHDAAQHQRPAGAGRQPVGLFQQQPGHAAADRAAANQGDAERFHRRRCSP